VPGVTAEATAAPAAGVDAVQPAPRGDQIEQAGEIRSVRVESLRGLACLAVLTAHTFGTAHAFNPATTLDTYLHRTIFGGGFSLFLFFALSGYLLYWPFCKRDFGDGRQVSLKSYARNRALRILPLYWIVVVVILVLQEGGGSFTQWWRFLTFNQSYFGDTVAGAPGQVNGPMWSVIVELHFYTLLPLLALGIAWLSRRRRAAATAIMLALAGGFLYVRYHFVTSTHGTGSLLWRYSTPANFYFFFPGMLLALLRLQWEEHRPRWLAGPLAHANVWMLASLPIWAIVLNAPKYDRDSIAAVAAFLMVGAIVLPLTSGVLVRVLDWRPIAVMGLASYSMYLWHVPIVDFFERNVVQASFPKLFLLAAPLSIVVALVSYALIERPFLRLRRRWAPASAPQAAGPPGAAPAPAH
jgi:peptidoglycan/LPS O-acetylase OafA/YrhL